MRIKDFGFKEMNYEKRKGIHVFVDDYSLDIKLCKEHFVEFEETVNSIK